MDLNLYTAGLEQILQIDVIFFIFIGTLLGILTGSIPGLSAMMGVSILIPLTYSLSSTAGILMLIGVYLGAVYGGAISATLVNIPGTPSAVMTALDAYPLAKKGQAGRALGISTVASSLGGLFSVITLVLFAPLIANLALEFTSYEIFAIAFFGLSIMAYISPGSMVKGLISGCIGLLIAMIGADPMTGQARFTFGSIHLFSGVQFIASMVGLYGVTEVILNIEKKIQEPEKKIEVVKATRAIPSWLDIRKLWGVIARSSVIGVVIGAIPGAGGTIASIVSYAQQKKLSKNASEMGKGSLEGVSAAESANNACTGGTMITLLSLGIPGDAVTAILIGAFMVHGIQPGPTMFQENIDLVSAIFLGMVIANIFILIIGLKGARYFARLLSIPDPILNSTILAFCFLGSFAVQNSFFDVATMLVFSILGYLMVKADIPRAPLVLAFILGPLMEMNLRRSLSLAQDDLSQFIFAFVERPIAGVVLLITLITLLMPFIRKKKIFKEQLK
ncbi:tripartite tricarboxylate transporter permease [Thalassobacillus devorans]|uniref:tripartite tricarboxylate transporter permease n=1 Tax=Thalassobacillus devorans TaxID=279813 RepID=UPI000A1CBB40|nr:tripartite tricarboxylate transporter permease [Thalassobacillus devorans]